MARLLLVDDDELVAGALKRVLERIGKHEVLLAHDGEAGLVAARKELPDIILLDILMPKMNGYEVLRELKLKQDTLKIPVIILSAINDEKKIKETLYEYDATYITKPVETKSLLQSVDHLLCIRE
jgi:twitching motility two-component system response regulator PilH